MRVIFITAFVVVWYFLCTMLPFHERTPVYRNSFSAVGYNLSVWDIQLICGTNQIHNSPLLRGLKWINRIHRISGALHVKDKLRQLISNSLLRIDVLQNCSDFIYYILVFLSSYHRPIPMTPIIVGPFLLYPCFPIILS
jgi:hypothetical protein